MISESNKEVTMTAVNDPRTAVKVIFVARLIQVIAVVVVCFGLACIAPTIPKVGLERLISK